MDDCWPSVIIHKWLIFLWHAIVIQFWFIRLYKQQPQIIIIQFLDDVNIHPILDVSSHPFLSHVIEMYKYITVLDHLHVDMGWWLYKYIPVLYHLNLSCLLSSSLFCNSRKSNVAFDPLQHCICWLVSLWRQHQVIYNYWGSSHWNIPHVLPMKPVH